MEYPSHDSRARERDENDDDELTLPEEYRFLPILALQTPSRKKLASFLDSEGEPLVVEIDSEPCDTFSDIFGLAELAGMSSQDLAQLKKSQSPTLKFLELWNKNNATVGNLWKFLMLLERYDVIQDCRNTVLNDCNVYGQQIPHEDLPRPNMSGVDMLKPTKSSVDLKLPTKLGANLPQPTKFGADGGHEDEQFDWYDEMNVDETKFSTKDDVENHSKTFYDAFVCFTDEDFAFVKELINELEGKRGLKLFVPGRNDLPGAAECPISAYLIEKRCRKMLIIISNKFLRSAKCDFQVQFARALSKGLRNRKLITIVYEKGVFIPRILRYRAHCDFTKQEMKEFVYSKLVHAITAGAGISDIEEKETLENYLQDSMGFAYPDCRRWKDDDILKDAPSIEYNDLSATGLSDLSHTEPKLLLDKRSSSCNMLNISPVEMPRTVNNMNITELNRSLSTENNETSLTEPKLPYQTFPERCASWDGNTDKAKCSNGYVKKKSSIKHCIFKTFRNIKERILKGKYHPRGTNSECSQQYLSSTSCNLSSCPDNNHVFRSEDTLESCSNRLSCPDNNHVFSSEDTLEPRSNSCNLSSCLENNIVLPREDILVPRSGLQDKYQDPVENSFHV
ncbi:uncharacterized protein LOC127854265 isoform X2 [Dreissena polymorpha]|uniref:uncharacterized protein LOC127854265 isoform X2 n=1 Tax=Dreissena polymorpha TaxID=45954 RepID=UPI0022649C53|nr:uncharacterized protein LOC127854265 isoform X2 [Dreissena polymorpha]